MMYELVCGSLPFGDSLNDEHSILTSILDDALKFPSRYVDLAGKRLIKDLLVKNPKKRLGSGVKGWAEIKSSKYFSAGGQDDLFGKISGRELPAPFPPVGEIYGDEDQLKEEGCTLSDSEELYTSESKDDGTDEGAVIIGKLRVALQKAGASKEGILNREMFGEVLKSLDSENLSNEDMEKLWEVMDPKRAGPVPLGRIVLVQDQIAAKILGYQKSAERRKDDAALTQLGTARLSVMPDAATVVIKKPSEPRSGPPRPAGAPKAAASAAAELEPTMAPAGSVSQKLREEVEAARHDAEAEVGKGKEKEPEQEKDKDKDKKAEKDSKAKGGKKPPPS
mmetsp:Transcript_91722/g.201088  ORF Transcript_91722/g.201088 Transcript_91722/m.201088 type:complete len:336 (-) Transcript_91722:149-1156(-)